MKRELLIKIADLSIRLKNVFFTGIEKRYLFFFSSPSSVSNTLSLKVTFLPKTNEKHPLVIQRKEEQVFQIKRTDFLAEIDFANFQGEVKILKNIYSFDSFLRILYSLYLSLNEGFLLHSAGVTQSRRAYLFSGSSLSGKTSIIRYLEPTLKRKDTILSDEIIAIRKREERRGNHFFFAYPTPFWGEFKSGKEIKNQGIKIEKVFFLGNGNLRKLSVKEAVGQLGKNIIFFSKDAFLMKKTLNLGIDFLYRTPIYQSSWKELIHLRAFL